MKAAEKFAKFGAAPIKNERYANGKSKVELICVSLNNMMDLYNIRHVSLCAG